MKIVQKFIVVICLTALMNSCGPVPIAPKPPVKAEPEAQLFSQAESAFQVKAYREALSFYDAYLSQFPHAALASQAITRKGEIYRALKDYKSARDAFGEVIERYPDSEAAAQARIHMLRTYYDEGAYKEVIRLANEYLKLTPKGSHAAGIYVVLGSTYVAMDSAVNAVYFYASANQEMGNPINQMIPQLKEIITTLSEADILSLLERVRDAGTRACLIYHLGDIQFQSGRYEEGASTLSQFIRLFPDHEYADKARRMIGTSDQRSGMARGVPSIGCLLPLSGSYSVYGNKALRGIELAVRSVQGQGNVNIIVKDTGSDAARAVAGVEELARENVSAIIGPIITAEAAAFAAQNKNIPIITFTQKDGVPEIGSYVFRHFLTPRMQVKALASYAQTLGISDFAVLYPDEKYGRTFKDLFMEEVSARGGQVTALESYGIKDTDFTAPIQRLLRQGKFQAMFIPDAPKMAGLIIPQLVFHNIRKIPLLGTNLWNSDELIRMTGRYAQGAVVPDVFFLQSESPKVREFIQEFKKTYGETPGFMEALAYDTALLLTGIFRQLGELTPEAVQAQLAKIRGFQGVTGMTAFDETGECHKRLYLLQLEGSRFVELPQSFSEP
jgi:ABC-type branched-subunit amino acid transport system substrate-binding protein/predicted CopG family antitoxin